MKEYSFPPGFWWGTAASAYQVEGGNENSDWHLMEMEEMGKPPGRRRIKEPCGKACDHWNRYEEDYDLARLLGVQVHRLSIEWSRVFPREQVVDGEALEHYRAMLRALHDRNIKIMLCLNHFTLPHWVAIKGGYGNGKYLLPAFEAYVETVVRHLGDLVDFWLPVNEPNVVPVAGFLGGVFPPFKRNFLLFVKSFRTIMAMQGCAYQVIKRYFPRAPVGVAFSFFHFQPYRSGSALDRGGAALAHRTTNLCFFQGVKSGCVGPPLGFGGRIPGLKGALDFVGINYYSTQYMKGLLPVESRPGDLVTDMGWIYYPRGIYEVLQKVREITHLPIIITENGVATTNEQFRIRYLREHLKEVHRAISEGINIKGYMYWSLTDNFEWQHGYGKRFGLVHVDYATQRREIKAGGFWLARVIRDNGFDEREDGPPGNHPAMLNEVIY